jgi:glyoxylase-like metal-dependent hydrolase (beta-lactamase superfamily II)
MPDGPYLASAAVAADAGIHRLPIPTPFAVGRVNTYLIEGDPLTLVDTGPNSGKALDELEQALAAHGRRVEDLELIVITHQHIDHLGLVGILARRSGAEVAALDLLAPYLGSYRHQAEADDAFSFALMREHGIPEDVAEALRSVSAAFRAWGGEATVTRPLSPGDALEMGGRSFEVLHRPGHSPSDTVFWDAERGLLIGADHLIKHISSNPLVTRPLPGTEPADGRRPQALLTYMGSLRATREMPARLVLSGHGDPIDDHVALIDSRLVMHARRARRIGKLIAERPHTAHEIAQALWGNVAVTQAYLTLSEVLGHVDILLAQGSVREELDDGVTRFAAV